jgi:hypothetical protein
MLQGSSGTDAALYVVVSWRDWDEWKSTMDDLFSEDNSAIERGINIVAAWRLRARLPVAVDDTAALCELLLRDKDE